MMNSPTLFGQSLHLGKAYLINAAGGSVIATGQGQFDVPGCKLRASFDNVTLGKYEGVLVVLETQHGYFAPLSIFNQSIIPVISKINTYQMESFVYWPASLPLEYIVRGFANASITVRARHFGDTYQPDSPAHPIATITKRAAKKDLETFEHDGVTVGASSTFNTSINHDSLENHAQFSTSIAFKLALSETRPQFMFTDIHKILSAFRLYWIVSHDFVDCTITRITVGEVQFFMKDASFPALTRNNAEYRSALDLETSLEIGLLAKLLHFYVNPDKNKKVGASSKIGLAFSRIAGRRLKRQRQPVDYEVIDLIFSLQSMAESIAQNEVSAANKKIASETKAGIEKVRKLVRSLQDELPKNVRDFYLLKADKTYGAITRPTFMRSIEITFRKLGISMDEYTPVLKEIDEARRQIVHSEKYDGRFILDLLTRGVATYTEDKDGNVISVALSVKTGTLDKLYELLKRMVLAYLGQYGS